MFRALPLPDDTAGEVYLHSMPGRNEPLAEVSEAIRARGIMRVISLAPLEEIREKSPQYAQLIERGAHGWQQEIFPIEDFGVPIDEDAYLAFFQRLSRQVRAGEKILLHCAAGIGRTGMGAMTLLMCLGEDRESAIRAVRSVGSGPEDPRQFALLERLALRIANDRAASGSSGANHAG